MFDLEIKKNELLRLISILVEIEHTPNDIFSQHISVKYNITFAKQKNVSIRASQDSQPRGCLYSDDSKFKY